MKVLDTKAKFHYGHNRSTTEGKQLKDYLDNMIAQHTDPAMPGAKVE